MSKKNANKKFGGVKKSGAVKKIKMVGEMKVAKKVNPVVAARKRTRIAAAKLAATRKLKDANLNNKATQKVIRSIVAVCLFF